MPLLSMVCMGAPPIYGYLYDLQHMSHICSISTLDETGSHTKEYFTGDVHSREPYLTQT